MNPQIITMRGPSDGLVIDQVDDVTLGLLVLDEVAKQYPGITVGQMVDLAASRQGVAMAGLLDFVGDVAKSVGNVIKAPIDYIGDKVSDVAGLVGRKGGEVVRLASDEDVAATVSRLATAYATGGTSEAAGGLGGGVLDFLRNLGGSVRSDATGVQTASAGIGGVPVWVVGAGAGLLVLSLIFGRRR